MLGLVVSARGRRGQDPPWRGLARLLASRSLRFYIRDSLDGAFSHEFHAGAVDLESVSVAELNDRLCRKGSAGCVLASGFSPLRKFS